MFGRSYFLHLFCIVYSACYLWLSTWNLNTICSKRCNFLAVPVQNILTIINCYLWTGYSCSCKSFPKGAQSVSKPSWLPGTILLQYQVAVGYWSEALCIWLRSSFGKENEHIDTYPCSSWVCKLLDCVLSKRCRWIGIFWSLEPPKLKEQPSFNSPHITASCSCWRTYDNSTSLSNLLKIKSITYLLYNQKHYLPSCLRRTFKELIPLVFCQSHQHYVIVDTKFQAITKVSTPPKGEIAGGTQILVMPWFWALHKSMLEISQEPSFFPTTTLKHNIPPWEWKMLLLDWSESCDFKIASKYIKNSLIVCFV
jgi:hypothetical protein